MPVVLLVDRSDFGHHGLIKAMLLARHLQAPLELYLCELSPSLQSRNRQGQSSQSGQLRAEAQAYLQALRQNIVSTDVEIRCASQVAASWADGLEQRLQRAAVLLVTAPVGAQIVADPRIAVDWSLLRACSAPLLLTRKRPWKAVPRFAAAIDLGAGADEELGAQLIGLAEQLTRRCSAHLEYLYAAPDAGEDSPAEQAWRRLTQLAGSTQASPGSRAWLHYLQGQPREVLPRLVGERGYDLLVMGCPRPQGGALAGFIDDDAPQPPALGRRYGHRAAVLENAERTAARLLRAADGDLLVLPACSGVQ